MKKILFSIALLSSCMIAGAQLNFTWELVPMDSTWDEIKDPAATNVILKYSDQIAPLQEIIGYSTAEYASKRPESGLSNFAVDAIRTIAEREFGETVDIAMTNFGGIRTSLPEGAVRVYDIFSIFPFDNYIVTFDIDGKDLQEFLDTVAAQGRIEALSNVELVVKDGKFEKCNVGGKPVDVNKVYKFATINFLMEGGDAIRVGQYARNIKESDVMIRDALVTYIKELTEKGEKLDLKSDGRVIDKTMRRPMK